MIAVVLINYKDYARNFLEACRDSLRLQETPFKVYLVDNASSPESLAYLKETYPEAILVPRVDGNYCAGNNAGAKKAIEDGAETLVFANMDTVFDKDWLKELVKPLTDETIGLVQSKVLLHKESGERVINSLGNKLHFLGFGFTDGYNLPDKNIPDISDISGYASGCSLALSSELFLEIGGYNEEYYMYHDDVELSAKIRLLGKRIVLAGKSVVSHKYEFTRSTQMIYYMERNRGIFILSFYPLKLILLLLPAFIISEIFISLAAIYSGWAKEKMRAYFYFLKFSSWKNIVASRKKNIPRSWFINFSGRLEFQEIDGGLLKVANPLMNLYWRVVKLFFR